MTKVPIAGANPTIDSSEFELVGQSAAGGGVVRTIIILKTTGGLRAFETFQITFANPT